MHAVWHTFLWTIGLSHSGGRAVSCNFIGLFASWIESVICQEWVITNWIWVYCWSYGISKLHGSFVCCDIQLSFTGIHLTNFFNSAFSRRCHLAFDPSHAVIDAIQRLEKERKSLGQRTKVSGSLFSESLMRTPLPDYISGQASTDAVDRAHPFCICFWCFVSRTNTSLCDSAPLGVITASSMGTGNQRGGVTCA